MARIDAAEHWIVERDAPSVTSRARCFSSSTSRTVVPALAISSARSTGGSGTVAASAPLAGGWIDRDLSALAEYVQKVALYARVPIPDGYPVVGRDAFRTGTGGHAAAIVKARAKGDDWLADRVYSGVPAGMFGLKQVIDVGPMSGESNVVAWLKDRGVEAESGRVAAILRAAKLANHVLADAEIRAILDALPEAGEPGEVRDAGPPASVNS